jgi:hypothetical protein
MRRDFVAWKNQKLAIPEHLIPFVAKIVRNDRCED